ncbi:unnamed protein product [Acanthoscelides obtectus]|uniref:Uncharacterized protein n=1 Tax=Acanthoscelides obtectus TaxID=200917 RepID=A0A9P0KR80_ACAOB|nr:unnamed protein product [Acanthoscelides obtectus]CAK1640174.1 hypothetical protein AOBTE_LOCUS11575 [Acanthoscelides obtectus]
MNVLALRTRGNSKFLDAEKHGRFPGKSC